MIHWNYHQRSLRVNLICDNLRYFTIEHHYNGYTIWVPSSIEGKMALGVLAIQANATAA